MLRRILLGLFLSLVLLPTVVVRAAVPPESPGTPDHVVRPGETLSSIARRYATDVDTLARLNGLADPREIYAGQRLELPVMPEGVDVGSWQTHALQLGETFPLIARRTGLAWETVAEVNHLLNPGDLMLGQSILLPRVNDPVRLAVAEEGETWLSLALRHGCSSWTVQALNPQPPYTGMGVLVPGEGVSDFMPYPLASLTFTPQPAIQGRTSLFELETVEPATCEITYLDGTEPCYSQDATHLYAFVSLSPLMDPGTYPLTLQISPETGGAVTFEFPLQVVVGRYGYERIDPIAGQQDLFDPVLLQGERDKLDAIAVTYRTPERYWQLPFAFPVNAAISSYFGSRRSYGGSYDSYHAGVDFRASTGVPARASQPGIVILAETLPVRGNAVMVDHGWGVLTGYWHLSRIDVQVGQYVEEGQTVGLVGSTGLSTGSHLHWEMWVDGRPIDPLQWVETFYEFSDPALLPVTEFIAE